MNLAIKRFPNSQAVPIFLLQFYAEPGARPLQSIVNGVEHLREFLLDRLGEKVATVTKVVAEAQASLDGTASIENIRLKDADVRALLKNVLHESVGIFDSVGIAPTGVIEGSTES